MSLSDLASLGSFVSGLAVLVSLVFLYFQMRQMIEQVRQSEQNQRALMSQGGTDRIGNILRWIGEPHVIDLVSRVQGGETKFTSRELYLLNLRFRQTMLSAQDAYVQHQAGLLDQLSWDTALIAIRDMFRIPVYRALWKTTRRSYAPEWVAFVEQETAGTPVVNPGDFVEQFNRALAEFAH